MREPLCLLVGSWAAALGVFGSPPWPHCRRPPREGRETKGNERKRSKSKLCNPSRSFFFFGRSGEKRVFTREVSKKKILEALSPESGAVFRADCPQTRGKAHKMCLRTFSVRAVRGVISGMPVGPFPKFAPGPAGKNLKATRYELNRGFGDNPRGKPPETRGRSIIRKPAVQTQRCHKYGGPVLHPPARTFGRRNLVVQNETGFS